MKIIKNFITEAEVKEIKYWLKDYNPNTPKIENIHIKEINDKINGFSILKDITKTEVSSYISAYQGDNTVVEEVPLILETIKDRIAEQLNLNKDHDFVQVFSMAGGGCVKAHYDAGIPGYLTYKCNANLEGPEVETVFVGKEKLEAGVKDLYCFEANLFKHWVDVSENNRIILSYGFIVPYSDLRWDADSPRVRLSERIWNNYIKNQSTSM